MEIKKNVANLKTMFAHYCVVLHLVQAISVKLDHFAEDGRQGERVTSK